MHHDSFYRQIEIFQDYMELLFMIFSTSPSDTGWKSDKKDVVDEYCVVKW